MPLWLTRPPSRPPSRILTSLLACLSTAWAAEPGTMTVCVHNAIVHNATGHNEGVDACEGDCEVHACIWVLSSSDDGGVHSSCQEGMASGYDGSDDKCWARCQTATVEEDSDAVDWSGECSCCSFDWVDGDSEVQVRAPLPYTSMESSSPVASHPHTSSWHTPPSGAEHCPPCPPLPQIELLDEDSSSGPKHLGTTAKFSTPGRRRAWRDGVVWPRAADAADGG